MISYAELDRFLSELQDQHQDNANRHFQEHGEDATILLDGIAYGVQAALNAIRSNWPQYASQRVGGE